MGGQGTTHNFRKQTSTTLSKPIKHIPQGCLFISFIGVRVGSEVEPTFSRGRGADAKHGRCDEDDADGLYNTAREIRRGRGRHQRSCRETGDSSLGARAANKLCTERAAGGSCQLILGTCQILQDNLLSAHYEAPVKGILSLFHQS